MSPTTGTVRTLPTVVCSNCIHVAIVRSGLECTLFNEALWDEREAQQCLGFERDQ